MPSTTNTTPSPAHETHEEDPLLENKRNLDDEELNSDDDISDFESDEEAPAEEAPAEEEEEETHAEDETPAEEEAAPAEEEAASDDEEDQPNTLQKNLRAAEAVQGLLEMIKGRKEVMEVLGNKGQVEAADKLIRMCEEYLKRAKDLFERARTVLEALKEAQPTSTSGRPMVKKATTPKKPMDPKRLPTQVLGVELSEGVKEALVRLREGQATVEDMEYLEAFFSGLLHGPLSNARALNPIDAHEAFLTAKGDKTRPNFDDETQQLYIFVKFVTDCLLLASKHYSVANTKSDLPEGGALVVENMTKVLNILALTRGLNPATNCRRMPSEKNVCGATTATSDTGIRLLSFLRFALDGSLGFDFTRQVKKALAKAIADLEKSQ